MGGQQDDRIGFLERDGADRVPDRRRGSGYLGTGDLREQQGRVRNDRACDYPQEAHPAAVATIGRVRLRGASARGPPVSAPSR